MSAKEPDSTTTLATIHRGSSHGQHDFTLQLKTNDTVVAALDYVEFQGQPSIQMLTAYVHRQGYGTQLLTSLQNLYPDQGIHWGMLTADGAALRTSLPHITVPSQYAGDFARLGEASLEYEQLQAVHRAFDQIQEPDAAQLDTYRQWLASVSERWNDLRDEIEDLQRHLHDKSPIKRLIATPELKIEVDGVLRPVCNANGKPIALTHAAIQNFWRWFGDAATVDTHGRPLVAYHGTRSDFTQFDGLEVVGWFSASPELAAQRYAMREGDDEEAGPLLMPVYLRMANPLVLDTDMDSLDENGDPYWWSVNHNAFMADAYQQGFDGVMARENGVMTYGVDRADQIKSALGNSGAFRPGPNIADFDHEAHALQTEATIRQALIEAEQQSHVAAASTARL